MDDVYGGSNIASLQSIEQTLEGVPDKKPPKPSVQMMIDEYSSLLNRISSGKTSENVAEIPGTLNTLWSWSPLLGWQGSIKTGKVMQDVWGPAFSIFAVSIPKLFFRALKDRQVAGGFVNRHLIFDVGDAAPIYVEPRYRVDQCPAWLFEAFKAVAAPPAPYDNREPIFKKKGGGVIWPGLRQIGWTGETKAAWFKFANSLGEFAPEERVLWQRTAEMALRVAVVYAVFQGRGVVELVDFEWGLALAKAGTRMVVEGFAKHQRDEMDHTDLVDFLRELFREKKRRTGVGVLTRGVIRKKCEGKAKNLDRDIWAALNHLIETGEIVEVEGSGGPGRPTQKWEWQGR
jgi:hypothetical protein